MLYLTERHHSLVLIWLVFILVVLIGKLAYQQISAQIIVSPQLKLDYSSEEAYGEWTAAHGHCLRASGRWPPGGLIGKDVWHLRWDGCKKRLKGTPVLVVVDVAVLDRIPHLSRLQLDLHDRALVCVVRLRKHRSQHAAAGVLVDRLDDGELPRRLEQR